MSSDSSWSLRGIDPRVRQAAREAARREGVTVGQWLNRKLLEGGGTAEEALEAELLRKSSRESDEGAGEGEGRDRDTQRGWVRDGARDGQRDRDDHWADPRDGDREALRYLRGRDQNHAPERPDERPDERRDRLSRDNARETAREGDRDVRGRTHLGEPVRKEDATSLARAVDQLSRRIDATEQRTTLAITGIDQSVTGIISRLKLTEDGKSQLSEQFDETLDEIDAVRSELADRILRLENDDAQRRNLEALKTLEAALGDVAAQSDQRTESLSEKLGLLETALGDVSQRFLAADAAAKQFGSDLARRIDTSNEHASLQLRRTREELEKQLDTRQTQLAEKLEELSAEAESARERIEQQLREVGSRVETAERATNNAIRALEGSFVSLDQRLNEIKNEGAGIPETLAAEIAEIKAQTSQALNGAKLEAFEASRSATESVKRAEAALNATLDARINTLEQRLMAMAEQQSGSAASAEEMSLAAKEAAIGALERVLAKHLADIESRLSDAEARQSAALKQVAEKYSQTALAILPRLDEIENALEAAPQDNPADIDRLIEARMREVESRSNASIARIGDEVARIAQGLQDKITASDTRQSAAFEDFRRGFESLKHDLGEQDARTRKLIEESASRTPDVVKSALETISRRLDASDEAISAGLSPMKRQLSSFAARIEVLEDRSTGAFANNEPAPPPFAEETAESFGRQTRGGAPGGNDPFVQASGTTVMESRSDVQAIAELERSQDIALRGKPQGLGLPTPEVGKSHQTPSQDRAADLDRLGAFDDGLPPLDDDFDDVSLELGQSASDPREEELPVAKAVETTSAKKSSDKGTSERKVPPKGVGADPNVINALRRTARGRSAAAAEASAQNEKAALGFSPITQTPKKAIDRRVVYGFAGLAIVSVGAAFAVMRSAEGPGIIGSAERDQGLKELIDGRGNDAEAEAPVTGFADATDFAVIGDALPMPEAASEDDSLSVDVAGEAVVVASGIEASTVPSSVISPDVTPPDAAPERAAATTPAARPAPATGPDVVAVAAPATEPSAAVAPVTEEGGIVVPASIRQAANSGNSVAQFQLGSNLVDAGRVEEGLSYIRQAANAGLAPAQYRLAKMYENGQGLAPDLAEARRWTERAAAAGNRKAMHFLGILHAEGRGTPTNFPEASEWFQSAAVLGSTDSQYNLAVLYEKGLGVPQSLPDAYAWFSIAGRAGDRGALERSREIGEQLPPEARSEADQAVRNFTPAPMSQDANGLFGRVTWELPELRGSAAVERAQSLLGTLGYDVGTPDGVVGSRTRSAIITYQRSNGLQQTGRVDAALLRRLEADTGR
jgi:localization factor PodJL